MWFTEFEDSRKHRMNICMKCEHKKDGIFGPKCDVCGCPLTLKVHITFTKCPLGKWETKGDYLRTEDYVQ
jgi:hypothetical protein